MAHQALTDYIKAARKKGHSDDQIQQDLTDVGWNPKHVTAALSSQDDLPVPPPPPGEDSAPRPVVQTLSTRGLEYIIMFIALAVSALGLASVLHSTVNAWFGSNDSVLSSGGTVPFAASALIVGFPIMAYLFLRLKQAELSDPALRRDPSRRRAIQLTLVVTFLIGLGNVIYFLYKLMAGDTQDYTFNAVGSAAASSLLGNFIHLIITLAITGGIFYYYWKDEHVKN